MSLAVLADHMASKGRGPDSMLIHMSPREVQGLQALAMKHGGSLTINPHTGLPEAGFLDKLLPAIIGFAITATTGIPAWQVGLGVGAVETARTGDLGKGISAGLGAYGGAGLGAGMSAAGSSALAADANLLAAQQATELSGLESMSGAFGGVGATAGADAVGQAAAGQATAGAVEAASPFDKISRGFDAAKYDPSSLLTKDNAKYLMAAAAPVLADQAVKANLPTTTTRPGEVHRFSYNPYNQYYTPAGNYEVPVKSAASGGIMGFDESSNSPMSHQSLNNMQDSGGMFNYAHDGGGVMKMAKGGLGSIAHFAAGGDAALQAYQEGRYKDASTLLAEAGMSAQDVVSKYGLSQADAATVAKNLGYAGDMSGLQYAAPPAVQAAAPIVQAAAPVVQAQTANTVAAAAPAYTQYTNEQIGSYLAANPTADIAAATKATNADPTAVNAYIASLTTPFVGSTATTGGSGTLGIYNQLTAQGVDPDEYYKAALANDPKYAGWSLADIKRGYNLDKGAYALTEQIAKDKIAADPTLGYDKQWVKFMEDGGYSVNDMAQAFGISKNDILARIQKVKDAETKTKPILNCGPGYRPNAAGTACEPIPIIDKPPVVDHSGYYWNGTEWVPNISATQNTSTNVTTPTNLFTAPSTSLPVGIAGNTGPSQIGGGATVNPNGTITTSPRIPGIPVGGFTGMEQVRDAYTTGGGKLGYVPYAPKTMDEFNAKYNKLTGGSKAAYDYLTGKTPYSPKPVTETGEIMKPYSESVLGMPSSSSSKQYLFDPTTKKYALNPDYIPVSYTSEGKKVYGLSSKDIAAQLPGVATSDYEKWMQDNNVTLAQIAQALNISLAEAKKRYPTAGSTTDKTTVDTNASSESSSGTGGQAEGGLAALTMARGGTTHMPFFSKSTGKFTSRGPQVYADGGMAAGGQFDLGGYSDGGRLLRGPGDGVSDSIPATIGNKRPARLADGEFVVPARIVSELGNGSTEAGARKLYAMMDRVQAARKGSIGKGKVANNSRADKYLPV